MACREAGAPLCAVFGMSERWPAGSLAPTGQACGTERAGVTNEA